MKAPLTPFEEKAARVLARVYRGLHHVVYWEKRKPCANGIELSVVSDLATYDFDYLTRLVVAAHDECVRVSVVPGGPRMLKLQLHPRSGREGRMWERHPTIEEAIVAARL